MRPMLIGGIVAMAFVSSTCGFLDRAEPTAPHGAAFSAVPGAAASANAPDVKNFVAHLSGGDEVPANASQGQGELKLQLSPDGESLSYRLIASNIYNVTASHIHIGPAGISGPVVAFLFGSVPAGGGRHDGVLATGTITAANLVGPLAGHPLSDLITKIEHDSAYGNAHTNDGVAPTNTGPGDFPGGEIRGQVRVNGPN